MKKYEKETTQLQQALQKPGAKNTVGQDPLARLTEAGIKSSRSTIHQAVAGSSTRPEVVETFLKVAEAGLTRRREMDERARKSVTEA